VAAHGAQLDVGLLEDGAVVRAEEGRRKMPIMPSDCADSERPMEEGRKLSCSIAAWTFFIASADTGPAPEMARDAVDMPTPASKAAPKVGFVSLGCPKALVDSEQILTQLRAEGYETAKSYDGADLVIVNTCGFIDAAVQESLDAIGEALAENGKVIVTGCLGAKKDAAGDDIITKVHPKVLAVTGPHAVAEVMDSVHLHLPKPHDPFIDLVPDAGRQADAEALRLPEDFRRLQPPLQLLHHPVDARRPGVAPDPRVC
jgi:hypothetical protein